MDIIGANQRTRHTSQMQQQQAWKESITIAGKL
jgi:hypothetical protein